MKWFKRIVLVLLIAIVIVGIVVLANGYGLYKDALEAMSLEDNNWFLPTIKINYCPMCGRKLGD